MVLQNMILSYKLVWYNNMAKESVYLRKELNSHRIGLVPQNDKRKCLHKKRVELPQDWFGTTTWPPFNCFATQYGCSNVMRIRSIVDSRYDVQKTWQMTVTSVYADI